jgi:hypothetical protein
MNDHIKFLIIFFLSVSQVLLLIAAINWWVDPYGIFHPDEYNPQKSIWMSKQLRLAKAYKLKQLKPQGIVMGTSSSQLGIDPEHPGWNKSVYPRYNISLTGASPYETLRYFQHSQAVSPPRQILIGLDFVVFNLFYPLSDDFKESHMVVSPEGSSKDHLYDNFSVTLFSLAAFKASQKKLFYRGKGTHYSNGRVIPEEKEGASRNNRLALMNSATSFVPKLLMPPPGHRFCLYDEMGSNYNFLYLRKILTIAKENGADVRLFIQPTHVYLLEVLRILGMTEDYKNWQKELINLVEDINNKYSKTRAFPLWHFGGYNSVTMTEVPPAETPNRSMLWYWDIGHYNKNLGDLIQDRIFSFHQPGRLVPDDFGIQISSKNIARHHSTQKIKQGEYIKTYPKDIKKLIERVNSVKKNIRPSNCNQLATAIQ